MQSILDWNVLLVDTANFVETDVGLSLFPGATRSHSSLGEHAAIATTASKKQKQGWEIKKLGLATERAFKLGDRIMRWKVEDDETRETLAVLYYTPVTKKLRANAGALLEEIVSQLRAATTGTLMGPALIKGSQIQMIAEIPPGTDVERIYRKGELIRVQVDYLDYLLEILEKEAVIYRRTINQ